MKELNKVDRKELIKLLAGTVARGLLWVTAAITAKYGLDAVSESTVEGVSVFLVGVAVAVASSWWSNRKDTSLALSLPSEHDKKK